MKTSKISILMSKVSIRIHGSAPLKKQDILGSPRESIQPKKKTPSQLESRKSVFFCKREDKKQQVHSVVKPPRCPRTIKF